MKILMLCLEFPPVNTTGNYRSAGFARAFINAGHQVEVITCTVDSGLKTFNKAADNNLLAGLEKIKIHRFGIKPISKRLQSGIGNYLRIWWNSTDRIDKRWYYGNNKKLILSAIENFKPDVIYVSLPPFSMSRVAIDIQRKFQIPLVTDMRDAWSLWATSPYSTRIHYYYVKRLERRLFNVSTKIVGVTQQLIDDFLSQHPHLYNDKFHVVYNGYDYSEVISQYQVKQYRAGLRYKIGYVGSFYYNPSAERIMNTTWYFRPGLKKLWFSPRKEKWEYRSPHFFLKALSLFNTKYPKHRIQFEFIGILPDWLLAMVTELGLEKNFKSHGFKSKKEVLSIQSTWDAILATSEKIENQPHFCLPSKIFDAIETGKQILAFVTPGAQLDFLKGYAQTVYFDPDQIEKNAEKLFNIIKSTELPKFTPLNSDFYREEQSKKLLAILEKTL